MASETVEDVSALFEKSVKIYARDAPPRSFEGTVRRRADYTYGFVEFLLEASRNYPRYSLVGSGCVYDWSILPRFSFISIFTSISLSTSSLNLSPSLMSPATSP